jgi:hypothetical protein
MNKNLLITALILCFAYFSYGQSVIRTSEDSIKTLLIQETAAYLVLPFSEMLDKYWVLDDDSSFFISLPDGSIMSANAEVLKHFDSVPDERHTVVEKTEFNIVVVGDRAYTTHTQTVLRSGATDKQYSHELRLLRRVNGCWKIHSASGHHFIPDR